MTSPFGEGKPLVGRRVITTRAVHQLGKLTNGLRALGAEPVEVPMLEIRSPEDMEFLDSCLYRLNEYDWLILTSSNTVRVLSVRAAEQGIDLTHRALAKVAAIGSATAEAARKAGFNVALVPEAYVAESLVRELEGKTAGKRVLLARASVARDVIPDALRRAGATVDVLDAYRNEMPEAAPEMLRSALSKRIDAVTFSSSSGVMHFAEAAWRAGILFPLAGVAAISIGPITSQTLREYGWSPAAEASPSDIPGLIDAVVRVLSKQGANANARVVN